MKRDLLIYGAGGFAREIAWLAENAGDPDGWRTCAFIDDDASRAGQNVNGIPVMSLDAACEQHPDAKITVAVGAPVTRRKLAERAEKAGFEFATLVHSRVERSRTVAVGDGTVICAGNILTVNITLGRHVQINLDCTIGHDVVMADYSTLAPGVHVSGWVRLEEGAYIGTGANIINGTETEPLVIGAGAVIGSGACVTRSVAPGVTAVGVPAKPLATAR